MTTTSLEKVGQTAQLIITVTVLAAFFYTIYLLMNLTGDLPASAREVLLILIGVLAGAFKDVVGYYMGSSFGSSKKDQSKVT